MLDILESIHNVRRINGCGRDATDRRGRRGWSWRRRRRGRLLLQTLPLLWRGRPFVNVDVHRLACRGRRPRMFRIEPARQRDFLDEGLIDLGRRGLAVRLHDVCAWNGLLLCHGLFCLLRLRLVDSGCESLALSDGRDGGNRGHPREPAMRRLVDRVEDVAHRGQHAILCVALFLNVNVAFPRLLIGDRADTPRLSLLAFLLLLVALHKGVRPVGELGVPAHARGPLVSYHFEETTLDDGSVDVCVDKQTRHGCACKRELSIEYAAPCHLRVIVCGNEKTLRHIVESEGEQLRERDVFTSGARKRDVVAVEHSL